MPHTRREEAGQSEAGDRGKRRRQETEAGDGTLAKGRGEGTGSQGEKTKAEECKMGDGAQGMSRGNRSCIRRFYSFIFPCGICTQALCMFLTTLLRVCN